jgi:hypothetical protein
VRWIGLIGFFAALVTVSADAIDSKAPCVDLIKENGRVDDSPALTELPFLTGNQCEAVKSRELRVPLLEIPQEEEDPMSLSLGVNGSGAMVHFKIPFSLGFLQPPPDFGSRRYWRAN